MTPASPSSAANRSVTLRPPVPLGAPMRPVRRTTVRLFGSIGVLVALGGFGAAGMMMSGQPVVVAFGLILAMTLALASVAAADLIFHPRRGRIEVVSTRGGIELPPIAIVRWSGSVGVALALLFASVAILAELNGVALLWRHSPLAFGVLLAIGVLVGAMHSSPSPARVTRIVLTPHGIGKRRGPRTRLVGWDEVEPPVLVNDPGVRVYLRRRDAARRLAADPMGPSEVRVLLPIAMCGSDPNLVLALIEHYYTHPGDRFELAGPEVIDRLRRGDLAVRQ